MVVWLRGQSGRYGVTGGMHIAVSGCFLIGVTGGVLVTRRVLNTNEGGG